MDLADVRTRLLAVEKQLTSTFVRRDDAVRVILLGVLAQVNYLFVGNPGTAKTSIIDRFVLHIDTPNRFKIQMGRFTQPDDVFGSLDIDAFKQGRREVVTDGMMPEAPFPVLDEALKASDGCMNSLLGILGPEREFRAEPTAVLSAGAATNWPEIDQLSAHVEALYDRFLLRCRVEDVDRKDPAVRRQLYRAAAKVRDYAPEVGVTVDELEAAHRAVLQVSIPDAVIDLLDGVVGRLLNPSGSSNKAHAVYVSDRRATQLQIVAGQRVVVGAVFGDD